MVSPMYWLPSCCKTLRLTKLYVASSCKEDVVLMQVSYPENNNIVPHAHSAYHDSKAKDFSMLMKVKRVLTTLGSAYMSKTPEYVMFPCMQ